MYPDEVISVFRIPAYLFRESHFISGDELIQIEETRKHSDRTIAFPDKALRITYEVSDEYFDAAWKITSVLFQNENLFRAVQFLKNSQDHFYVFPGEIRDIENDPDLTIQNSFRQVGLEAALQNAFKAIEAVLGDPSKKETKFFEKIKSIGLDPHEEVGYIKKDSLHKVIKNMNDARDKKSAHGSIPNRSITFSELLEYQSCAHYVVSAGIESKLGEPMFK